MTGKRIRRGARRGPPAGYIYGAPLRKDPNSTVIGFGNDRLHVREIPCRDARKMVVENHYSGKFVNNSYVHLGVVFRGKIKGVMQFGYAMNPASGSSVVEGTGSREYLELNRMWISDACPRNTESMALGHAIRYIRRAYPAVRWVQSFADERCGGMGVVYQAAGFVFLGTHKCVFLRANGEYFHHIALDPFRGGAKATARLRAAMARGEAEKITVRQFRYIRFLAPRFARGLKYTPKPFPKPDNAARPLDAPVPTGASRAQPPGAAP